MALEVDRLQAKYGLPCNETLARKKTFPRKFGHCVPHPKFFLPWGKNQVKYDNDEREAYNNEDNVNETYEENEVDNVMNDVNNNEDNEKDEAYYYEDNDDKNEGYVKVYDKDENETYKINYNECEDEVNVTLNVYNENENEDYGGLNDYNENDVEVYVKGDVYDVNEDEYGEDSMDEYDANENEQEVFWEDNILGYWQDDLEATELFDDLAYDVDIYDYDM